MRVIQSTSSGGTDSNVDIAKRKIVNSKSLKNTVNKPTESPMKQKCGRCEYKHEPRKCPALGKFCHNCKKEPFLYSV